MFYCKPNLDDDESLKIVHSALVLEWTDLVKRVESSQDLDNVKFYCRLLLRVCDMLQAMEEVDF